MAKQLSSQKFILKIHTKRLRKLKWRMSLALEEAKKNKEVISLADSQTLTFIDNIIGMTDRENKIKEIKKKIKQLSKREDIDNKKETMKQLNKELNRYKYNEDYICIVVDKISDFDRCNIKKGFFVNGKKYKRLLGTTGGIKNSTIVYVTEDVYDGLTEKINNGRNPDKKLVPAKLEAYKALTCSASNPVTHPKEILVVGDCITKFKEDIIKIDDSMGDEPTLTYEKDYEVELIDSDGYGLIRKDLCDIWAKDLQEDHEISGFCIRNSWTKGMVFPFPFIEFAEKYSKNNYIVKDVWGQEHDIRNVDLILTTSMLKLWDSYESIEHFLKCCDKNGYTFRVTKMCPKQLENQRATNYQFLQSFELNDGEIDELIKPTVTSIKESLCGDYAKTLLFLRGTELTEDKVLIDSYDYVQALMIEKELINDPFIRQKVINMRKKRINDAKVGVLDVAANYSIISGDPFSLCQSIFGLEVTGLIKPNHCYSKYWLDKNVKEILAMRAPMSCHNNIRKLTVDTNPEMDYWYQYMKTCLILSSWDTVTHAENGADKDSDSFFTTNNEILLKNYNPMPAIFCIQKSALKKVVTEEDLVQSNKDGFGDEIGSTTNKITEMFEVLAQFKKDSEEYKILMYRIMCGQHFQQCAIDKIKGIKSKPMPKEWYDLTSNKIDDEDSEDIKKKKELNLRILSNKKPYFFQYIYPHLKNNYESFKRESNNKCLIQFGISLEELMNKENKNYNELEFLKYYNFKNPLGENPCVMNVICKKIEREFDNLKDIYDNNKFDFNILKTNKIYSKSKYNKISKLHIEYNYELSQFKSSISKQRMTKEERYEQRKLLINNFKEKCLEICSNSEELCNILVDLCYKSSKTKQFVWDICGEQIIKNLLIKNNYTVNYPEIDDNGDIEFNGYKFTMKQKQFLEDIVRGGVI